MPTSDQTLTLTHSVQIWQHQMTRQAPVDTAIQLPQYRKCLAPALELSLQHPASPQYDLSGSISYPTTDRHDHCQSFGHCQPSNNSHVLIHTAQLSQMPPTTSVSSPKTKVMSAETETISDFCPPYNTPLPLTTASAAQAAMSPTIKVEGDNITVSPGNLHLESNQLSQFGLGWTNASLLVSDQNQPL